MRRPGMLVAGVALLLAAPMHAQDRIAEVDRLFSFATAETPGCAVGASQRGRIVVDRAYGLANVEQKAPLTRESRFDIGSTQKQFTAAAVLMLAEAGRLSLADDIRKHLPELPDYGHTVTVNHLLTHTGGIRDWTGMLPMAPDGTDAVQLIMRQRGLNFVPGTEWSYSNGGYELAKAIVARVSGMSFAEFARQRLFEPLGMKATAYVPDIMHAGPKAAMGYQKDGAGWKPYMRLGANRGGGAIVSTIGDMLAWQDALAGGKLGRFVTDRMQEPARLTNGRQLKYARGLIVDSMPDGILIWHSGGAAGFSTFMGRAPAHGLSVVASCNFDPVSATNLARRVLREVLLPPYTEAQKALERASVRQGVAGVDVSGRAGLFFDERTGEPLRMMVEDGRLVIANGPALVPVSATSFRPPRPDPFFRSQDDFELTFIAPDRLEIRSMEGEVSRYRRAQPFTPAAGELTAVEGRYESTELGSVFEVAAGANGLTLRMEGRPERTIPVAPVAPDTYMLRMMIVRFQRDANGKVTGFDYSNPVAKHFRFTRLGDLSAAAAPAATPPGPASSGAPPTAATAAPKLESLVGEYELMPGRTLTITLEGGRLHGQTTGGAKLPLQHESGTTFSVVGRPITVTFSVDADGLPTSLVMKQNGNERTLRRL